MKARVFSGLKTRVFNGYTYFVLGVLLFTGLTFLQLPCPACGGTGIIKGAKGLEVSGVEAELTDHIALGIECGWDYERYTYNVNLMVANPTSEDGFGVILVTFHDPTETFSLTQEEDDEEVVKEYSGETLQAFPVFVEVPAKTTRTIEKTLQFEGITLELFGANSHLVEAHIADEYACPFHGATAKVPFTEWLRLR